MRCAVRVAVGRILYVPKLSTMLSLVIVAMHVKLPVRGKFTDCEEKNPPAEVVPTTLSAKPATTGVEDHATVMFAVLSAVPFVK